MKKNPMLRALKVGLVAFVVVVIGLAVSAWLAGEPEKLPFQYEGFNPE